MTAREEPHVETADLDAIRAALDGTDVAFALLFGSHGRSGAKRPATRISTSRFGSRIG